MENKWLIREARIITEDRDEKHASGFKNGDRTDYMGAIAEQVREKHEYLEKSMRYELIRQINAIFDVSLSLNGIAFAHGDNIIALLKEIPSQAKTVHRFCLDEMPADMFRETIGECLSIIPGGLQHFREIAETSPYIF